MTKIETHGPTEARTEACEARVRTGEPSTGDWSIVQCKTCKSRRKVEIVLTVETVRNPVGCLRPFSLLYSATGPDGRMFDNRSKVTIQRVIRSRYPDFRVTFAINDQTSEDMPLKRKG